MTKKELEGISKRVLKKSPDGIILEEKFVEVWSEDIDKAKKLFEKYWGED